MLDSYTDLQLEDFSSLFEIAATLNLVYVVAERTKQYGSTLTKNFFQFETNIEKKFNDRFSLIDKESVETMPAIFLGNGSTEGEIQKAKRDIHKLEESKQVRISKLNEQTNNRCVLTSFSFIALYMFFYSILALFVGALPNTPFVKGYFTTFTLLSVLVLIFVSALGEKEKLKWVTNNKSLTKCCWTVLILCIISFIGFLYKHEIDFYSFVYWPLTILISVILPYMAFVIFMMIIHKRLTDLSADLKKELSEFNEECLDVENHIHQLKNAYELSVSMESNNTENEEKNTEISQI